MTLDVLRSIGLRETEFSFIAAALKADKHTQETLSVALDRPLSTAHCAAAAVAKEILGEHLSEISPLFYASTEPFIAERNMRIENAAARSKILKALVATKNDLYLLQAERSQKLYAVA
jgi:hypothetical protein